MLNYMVSTISLIDLIILLLGERSDLAADLKADTLVSIIKTHFLENAYSYQVLIHIKYWNLHIHIKPQL